MTIKRMVPVIVGNKIKLEEKYIVLSYKELRAAYQEQLLKDKVEDVITELKQMEQDSNGEFQANMLYADSEAIAKDLIEHMEYDEQGYWDKVRQTIERFM